MADQPFTAPDWVAAFEAAGYTDFEAWWQAEKNLVEEGNFRGKDAEVSWSHVSRLTLPDGRTVYLKRQQNHYPNNILLKLRRILTFELEWRNFRRLEAAGVPTLRYVHFATRKQGGHRQSILVSEELQGMVPICDYVEWCEAHGWPRRAQRLAVLGAVVKLIKNMHEKGIIHNALYPRHIYINIGMENGHPVHPETYKACLIDLERTKYPGPNSPKMFDLDLAKMYRRIPEWPAKDGLWFLKRYLGIEKLTPEAKGIARKIAAGRAPRSR